MATIAILHDAIPADAPADQQDTLAQVALVGRCLRAAGHKVLRHACDLNLASLRRWLAKAAPDLVFNLVETLAGHGRLIHLVPGVLDSLAIPYAGTRAEALMTTSHKTIAKALLAGRGMSTPAWMDGEGELTGDFVPGPWIIKAVWEHASFALDDHAVVTVADPGALAMILAERRGRLGVPLFAERYVEGREFNLSVLDGEVLPPAEIEFVDYAAGRPRIVNYAAKWDTSHPDYRNTPRRFVFPAEDRGLLDELRRRALATWDLFGLRGWARVDFRVDAHGRPWILEVNANPCLAADAGFMAAVQQAGLDQTAAVVRIAEASSRGGRRTATGRPIGGEALPAGMTLRDTVETADVERVRRIVTATGFFRDDEIAVAAELVEERLAKGLASGYHFVFLDQGDRTVGYACHGPIACTIGSHDLYWIAVDPAFQGKGLGRAILAECERCIGAAGGRKVYIETASTKSYVATRAFYERCNYRVETVMDDFYAPGDSKVVFSRCIA